MGFCFIDVDGALLRRIPFRGQAELAVDADIERLRRRLPEEAGGRNHERVDHVPGVAPWRGGECTFDVVADEDLHQPLVAVEAETAAGVEII